MHKSNINTNTNNNAPHNAAPKLGSENKIKEKSVEYYDDNVSNVKKHRASFSATLKSRAKIISRMIKKHRLGGDLLDAGCGTGHILYTVMKENKNNFSSIEAIDFSIEACKNASKVLGIKTTQCDLKDTSKIKKKFDLIMCSEVLEHIDDDEKILRNFHSLLKENGKVLITVPYLKKNWGKFDEISGHVRRYELGEMENKLSKAGFQTLESFGWGNLVYDFYFKRFLKNKDPHSNKIQNLYSRSNFKKHAYRLASNLLVQLFLIDNIFTSKNKGKTLFILAKKI